MKKLNKLLALLLLLSIFASTLLACNNEKPADDDDNKIVDDGTGDGGNEGGGDTTPTFIDYVASVKLDETSDRLRTEATVHQFVDGDTTHFDVPTSVSSSGVLKARYIAINTPESTGQIEPWGKKASNFTKEKLSKATSIILESNTSRWDRDSTGDRFLVWVWYRTSETEDYRNLNLEIMQEGLAFASSYTDYVYADACRDILAQARAFKLHVHDRTQKDPDFYYGDGVTITLKELKTNIEKYNNTTVRFEGVVVKNSNKTVYVEEYDEETGIYYGMQVYYGFNLNYFGEEILQPGNRVLIVGSVQYYEAGGTYQISDIYYFPSIPDHEKNIQLISEGNEIVAQKVDVNTLLNGKVTVTVTNSDEDGNETTVEKELDYGFLVLNSMKKLENLTIIRTYTTTDPTSSSQGAISIYCEDENGVKITLRTVVMLNPDGSLVTADAFPVGSKINAVGLVDYYNGTYQLEIYSPNDITFVN